jgi:hypothetical protein
MRIGEYEFNLDVSNAIYTKFFNTDLKDCWKPSELEDFEFKELGEYLLYLIKHGANTVEDNKLPANTLYICFDRIKIDGNKYERTISVVCDDVAKHTIYKVRNIKVYYYKPDQPNEYTINI